MSFFVLRHEIGGINTSDYETNNAMKVQTQPTHTAIASDGFLDKTELAQRLRRTPRTVEKWMRCGRLPYLKIGRSVLFDWGAVQKHLNENYQQVRRPQPSASLRSRPKPRPIPHSSTKPAAQTQSSEEHTAAA